MRAAWIARAGVLLIAFVRVVHGQATWDGGGDPGALWSDALNWWPDVVPPSLSPGTLTSAGSGSRTQDLSNPFPLTALTFASLHTVSGGALRVSGTSQCSTTDP